MKVKGRLKLKDSNNSYDYEGYYIIDVGNYWIIKDSYNKVLGRFPTDREAKEYINDDLLNRKVNDSNIDYVDRNFEEAKEALNGLYMSIVEAYESGEFESKEDVDRFLEDVKWEFDNWHRTINLELKDK